MGAASYGRSELRAAGAGPVGPQPLVGNGRGGGGGGETDDKVWRRLQLNAEVTRTDTSFQQTHCRLLLVSPRLKVYSY